MKVIHKCLLLICLHYRFVLVIDIVMYFVKYDRTDTHTNPLSKMIKSLAILLILHKIENKVRCVIFSIIFFHFNLK